MSVESFYEGMTVSEQKLQIEKSCATGCDKYLQVRAVVTCSCRLYRSSLLSYSLFSLSLSQSYKGCVGRFNAIKGETEANCAPYYMDFWHCVDECAAPKIFAKLK